MASNPNLASSQLDDKGLLGVLTGPKSEALLPVGIIGTVLIMVVPVPPWLMDLLLATSIMISLLILFVGIYTLRPLDFSVFPSLLLVVTLLRLALNVATTRLILLHGNEGSAAAGHLIAAFASFVIGGNYVVGLIIFFILVVINFVVITKGAGRIAEVSARFTLDAMPGKQMSIDADLNAGLIDENQARSRRQSIEQEADFYGAMDGASKFVRGDAVAGIIILLINLLGGLVIGVTQHGLSLAEAARIYMLLTVGDGLVSQIPARLSSHVEIDDLINSGIIGLIDALRKFDATLKIKFKTYAEFRIKGAILDELHGLDWVPSSTRQKATRLEKAYAEVEQRLGRSASDAEMMEFLEVEAPEFNALVREARGVALISLDELRSDGDNSFERNLLEYLTDPDHLSPAESLNLDQIYHIIAHAID